MAPVRHDSVKYTLASLAIENLNPSDEAIELCNEMADGKISADDAIAAILKKHGISQVKRHD